MLTIAIQGDELWDEDAEQFRYGPSTVIEFEHSLISLSKWEARFHKLFLTPAPKTDEEMVGYIEAMVMTPGVILETLNLLTEEHLQEIDEYINNPMTGTTFSKMTEAKGTSSERFSAELIYFWMNQYAIPYEAREWHLNQLFTLIRTHHVKSQKPQKMSKQARAAQMAELNAQRRAERNSNG